ncbi:MAG: alkaline shock response membrane anchor protein AmaP [Clostridia bacterium]
MKLNVFDRILLAILLIIVIVCSFVLLAVAANLVPVTAAKDFVELFYAYRQNAWILAGCGIVLLLLSVKLLFSGREKIEKIQPTPASTLIKQGENGGTFIALEAIDTMVQKHCRAQSRIRDCHSTLRAVEDGVTIGIRLSVLPDTDIVKLTEELQTSLKAYIQNLTGINVKEIGILVESTSAQPAARVE